jgi:AcrR family transcriptional regulator
MNVRIPMSKDERHAHILQTAKALFQERGYDHVTIADVIAASNIARGTFYLHFDSLESLLSALFDQVVDETWRRIAPILNDLSIPFTTCTVEVIRAVFRMFDGDPSMGMVFHSGGGQSFVERKQEAMYKKLGGLLVDALIRRHGNELNHIEWTVAILITLVGNMSSYATLYILATDKTAFEDKLIEFVLAGLREHLSPIIDL